MAKVQTFSLLHVELCYVSCCNTSCWLFLGLGHCLKICWSLKLGKHLSFAWATTVAHWARVFTLYTRHFKKLSITNKAPKKELDCSFWSRSLSALCWRVCTKGFWGNFGLLYKLLSWWYPFAFVVSLLFALTKDWLIQMFLNHEKWLQLFPVGRQFLHCRVEEWSALQVSQAWKWLEEPIDIWNCS